ncbi:hypothetical protein ACA910_010546 [Epithemia clementina (nom. ined.)]
MEQNQQQQHSNPVRATILPKPKNEPEDKVESSSSALLSNHPKRASNNSSSSSALPLYQPVLWNSMTRLVQEHEWVRLSTHVGRILTDVFQGLFYLLRLIPTTLMVKYRLQQWQEKWHEFRVTAVQKKRTIRHNSHSQNQNNNKSLSLVESEPGQQQQQQQQQGWKLLVLTRQLVGLLGTSVQLVGDVLGQGVLVARTALLAVGEFKYWQWMRTHPYLAQILTVALSQFQRVVVVVVAIKAATSHALHRALYVWYRLGPILLHYRWTRVLWRILRHPDPFHIHDVDDDIADNNNSNNKDHQRGKHENVLYHWHQQHASILLRLFLQDLGGLYGMMVAKLYSSSLTSSPLPSSSLGLVLGNLVPGPYHAQMNHLLDHVHPEVDAATNEAREHSNTTRNEEMKDVNSQNFSWQTLCQRHKQRQWPLVEMERIVQKSLNQTRQLDFHAVFDNSSCSCSTQDAVPLFSNESTYHGDDSRLISLAVPFQVYNARLSRHWSERLGLMTKTNNESQKNVCRNGYDVTVTVLHPKTRRMFKYDLQVLEWLGRIAGIAQWGVLQQLFRKELIQEVDVDYREEAQVLDELYQCICQSPYSEYVAMPRPIVELSCENVLVLERFSKEEEGNITTMPIMKAIDQGLATALDGNEEKLSDFIDDQENPQDRYQRFKLPGKTGQALSMVLHRNYSFRSVAKLSSFQRRYQRYVFILLGLQGYLIFGHGLGLLNPCADHFLQIKSMDYDRPALAIYGNNIRAKRISDQERLGAARVICALASEAGDEDIAKEMRDWGFQLQFPAPGVNADVDANALLAGYARVLFNGRSGKDCNPEDDLETLASLMDLNPLVNVPEFSLHMAKASLLFREMGRRIGIPPIKSALHWEAHARHAIIELSIATNDDN